jgi:methyltransferase (TIGR00027 family)
LSNAPVEKKTAIGIAWLRCYYGRLPEPQRYDQKVFDHELHFLPLADQLILRFLPFLRRPDLLDPGWGGLAFNLCRAHVVDNTLVDAVGKGFKQVVLLGAGADCRATRHAALLQAQGVKVFELDLPNMVAYKKRIVTEKIWHGPGLPEHITYVPIDFNNEAIDEALLANGFDPELPSVFNWEGVSYYLPPESVDATMAAVARVAAPGSLLLYDYLLDSVVDGSHPHKAAKLMMDAFKSTEPLIFGLNPAEVERFTQDRGFEVVEHLQADDLQRRFLMKGDGHTPYIKASQFFHIVVAEARPREAEAS